MSLSTKQVVCKFSACCLVVTEADGEFILLIRCVYVCLCLFRGYHNYVKVRVLNPTLNRQTDPVGVTGCRPYPRHYLFVYKRATSLMVAPAVLSGGAGSMYVNLGTKPSLSYH